MTLTSCNICQNGSTRNVRMMSYIWIKLWRCKRRLSTIAIHGWAGELLPIARPTVKGRVKVNFRANGHRRDTHAWLGRKVVVSCSACSRREDDGDAVKLSVKLKWARNFNESSETFFRAAFTFVAPGRNAESSTFVPRRNLSFQKVTTRQTK